MLVWQWLRSQGSAVRLLHCFLLWHCLLALTCWGFHFLTLQTLGFGAVCGACTPKQRRDRHRWHITDACAGSVAFGRTQSCFVLCLQGPDISLRCQDRARDGPVVFCSYTLICAAPAKPGQLVTECKGKNDPLLLLCLILFQTPQSYAAATSLGPVAVC